MSIEVRLPQWGMGMDEGVVVHWFKSVGDHVEVEEDLVEIEAAKVTETVPSPIAGTVREIRFDVDQTVPVREVLAVIEPDQ